MIIKNILRNTYRTVCKSKLPEQDKHLNLFINNNQITSFHTGCFVSQKRKIIPHEAPLAATNTVLGKDESRDFMSLFPDIVRDLTEAGRHLDIPDVTKWYAKVLQYNVPSGKKNRGLAVVVAYKMLAQTSDLTPENIELVQRLGWCVEMLQAFLLVADDVMDNATTRRGRPCWYRKDHIGLTAFNDAILLEQGVFQLLRKYFSNHSCYVQLMHLFHDVTYKTSMGQSLDLISCGDLNKFTMDRYEAIVKYKTAYYSFQLPVGLAMYMAGMNDPESHRQAKILLLEMGHFFQVQDDYLDCFGTPDVTGKIGTDIEDGKCSWLSVVALQRATPEQKKIMEDCYGSKDPSKVSKVKDLYLELGLPQTFATYEEETYNLINTHIQQLSRGLNQELFYKILDKIYKRKN